MYLQLEIEIDRNIYRDIYLFFKSNLTEFQESSLFVCIASFQLCLTLCDPMASSHQASLSMEFSKQEYWSGLPCPPPGDLPNPGSEPTSLTSSALADGLLTTSVTPGKIYCFYPRILLVLHLKQNFRRVPSLSGYSRLLRTSC